MFKENVLFACFPTSPQIFDILHNMMSLTLRMALIFYVQENIFYPHQTRHIYPISLHHLRFATSLSSETGFNVENKLLISAFIIFLYDDNKSGYI